MNRHELKWALYCAAEVVNMRRLRGEPIPTELRDFADELKATWEMTGNGHESCPTASVNPILGVMEVAAMLNRTERHVRRIAPRLGAERVNGTRVFNRAAVEEYVRTRNESA